VIRRIAAFLLVAVALRPPALIAQTSPIAPAPQTTVAAAATPAPPPSPVARVARGTGGAVAAAEENAARAGIDILNRGGNAADAAVAVAFALAVTWPEAGNIGGGGFWNSRDARGRSLIVDYRESAPRLAARDLFTRPGRGGVVPSSTEGALASGVPGSVAGLALAHRRTGRLPWKTVVEPAVRLAGEGFAMSEAVSESIAGERERLAKDPEAARIFLPGGAPPAPGKIFKQPDLARTLAAIRDRGEDGFYRGETARRFEESQRRAGGLISRGDLARYEAKIRQPLRFRFEGAEIVTTPAPSSGPVLAEMALAVARVADKVREPSPLAVHWVAEIEKRAFRDRNRWLGDPAFPGVRERLFTDPARIERLVASIDPLHATSSARLATVFPERPTTTHFSVMDKDGMAVSITTTLNDSFGSARVAPGLGFLLNNEMDDFATRPGEKNMYGLVQGDVNAVAPGKRMLSSMCPSIGVVGGKNVLVWGTPGGSTIPTTNLQVLVRSLLRKEPLGDALSGARFHQQDQPDEIEVETGRFDAEWLDALRAMGHEIKDRRRLGCVHAIAVEKDGTLVAAADPRGSGAALVARGSR
jgi:gamma-glutamyltranspeptidase/glutathione hydrolase